MAKPLGVFLCDIGWLEDCIHTGRLGHSYQHTVQGVG